MIKQSEFVKTLESLKAGDMVVLYKDTPTLPPAPIQALLNVTRGRVWQLADRYDWHVCRSTTGNAWLYDAEAVVVYALGNRPGAKEKINPGVCPTCHRLSAAGAWGWACVNGHYGILEVSE
jgi:hypothetical protein